MAYEKRLISSKPTGNKYQATSKAVRSKLIPNFDMWTDKDKKKFSLRSVATGVLDKTEVDDRIFDFLKKAGQKARGIFE